MSVLPANASFLEREQASVGVSDQVAFKDSAKVNDLVFNGIGDVVQYINEAEVLTSVGASVGVNDQAIQIRIILDNKIHDKVKVVLKYLKVPRVRADIFDHLHINPY